METGLEQQCIAYSLDQGKHFEKYYGIRIIINNKKVLKYSYNGKFRQADGIDYALRVLQRDIHFKYERANDEEIIYIN